MTSSAQREASLPKKMPTIPELIVARDKLVEALRAWVDLEGSVYSMARDLEINLDLHHFRSLKDTERQIEVGCWRYVLDKSNVLASMTEKAKYDYLEKLEKSAPRFCVEELEILLHNAGRMYSEGFEQTIKEVHRQFIECEYNGSDWRFKKKDNRQKIEHFFRCRGPFSKPSYSRRFHCSSGGKFEDLLTACYLLDGKKKPDYSNNFYSLAEAQLRDGGSAVKTPYFSVKIFLNGNCWVTWNPERQDILDKLNRKGTSGGITADGKRKRYKKEHFTDGQNFTTDEAHKYFNPGDDLQFFETGRELAEVVIELARPEPGLRWLEPSAGHGGLAVPLLERLTQFEDDPGTIKCLEIDSGRFEILYSLGLDVHQMDFLKAKPGAYGLFDRIVMNPPFHNQADVYHVLHALGHLKPGGGLAAIMSASSHIRDSKVSEHLRERVKALGGYFRGNPSGSFLHEGTAVETVTLVIPPNSAD